MNWFRWLKINMSECTPAIQPSSSLLTFARPSIVQQISDFGNVFKAFIGTNYLGLPFAFKQSGLLLGIGGLFLVAILTDHCCQLIIKCKKIAVASMLESSIKYQNAKKAFPTEAERIQESVEKNMRYGDIARVAFGRWGLVLVNIALITTQFGFCVGYFIFMGNTMTGMFPVKWQLRTSNESQKVNSSSDTLFMNSIKPYESDRYNYENSSTMDPPLEGTSTAPAFVLLLLFPLLPLVLMSFIRDVRKLGPVSSFANLAILGTFFAVFGYMLSGFHFKLGEIKMANIMTFPVFFGQVTGAYEGIGTIIPIESSMAENRPRFPVYLHLAIGQVSVILGCFGILGYMIYGNNVPQIVTDVLPRGPLSFTIWCTILVGILFTYPLQLFPIIQIFEGFLFDGGKRGQSKFHELLESGEADQLLRNDSNHSYESINNSSRTSSTNSSSTSLLPASVNDSEKEELLSDKSKVDSSAPVYVKEGSCSCKISRKWKRNILRTLLVILTAAVAVVFKNQFAYVGALNGSIGSSVLAYILPAAIHLAFLKHKNSIFITGKDIFLIVFGIVGGIVGVAITIEQMVKQFSS